VHHVARLNALLIAHIVEDFDRRLRQSGEGVFFPLNLHFEAALLPLESTPKEKEPGLPVRRIEIDRGLRLAQGQVVVFVALFDALSSQEYGT
jgi:hypothetical protein